LTIPHSLDESISAAWISAVLRASVEGSGRLYVRRIPTSPGTEPVTDLKYAEGL
jgi:hypothetical protein